MAAIDSSDPGETLHDGVRPSSWKPWQAHLDSLSHEAIVGRNHQAIVLMDQDEFVPTLREPSGQIEEDNLGAADARVRLDKHDFHSRLNNSSSSRWLSPVLLLAFDIERLATPHFSVLQQHGII